MEINLDDIIQPTLLINQNICHNNIENMVGKAHRHGIELRPHFKTHQSALIGSWFKAKGVKAIATSSFDMALYFANHGWDDITVAFPVNVREMIKINELAKKIDLQLLVESKEQIIALREGLNHCVHVYIKIDTGYGRTGLLPSAKEEINQLIQAMKDTEMMKFEGFLSHSGHTYEVKGERAINAIHRDALAKLKALKETYQSQFPNLRLSLGDTPSASVSDFFGEIDELRPGNFVFYDLKQYQIGSCNVDQIAVAAVCPIVAIHHHRQEFVIYGGAVHLSKDFIVDEHFGKHHGLIVPLTAQGWGPPLRSCYVKSLSQEHGIVKMDVQYMDQYKVGDLIAILPAHSCLVMDKIRNVMTLNGENVPKMGTTIQ